ncbi:MAG: glycoside hydrolase [Clostridium sp.]|nr:glycoside hydrolase [Clostridium sp.]
MKTTFILTSLLLATSAIHPLQAQKKESNAYTQCLFQTPEKGVPYRIPAIATTRKGDLVAMGDYRYCGGDIGNGQVDIVARISRDNGRTWGDAFTVAAGSGFKGEPECGYGDAALVADRKSNSLLLIVGAGNVTYWQSTRQQPVRVARLYSHDGGQTWSQPEDITSDMYRLFDSRPQGTLQKLFVASGKICQSSHIRHGKYYRLYAALCTNKGSFAIYSDDFGQSWQVLGGTAVDPAPGGDEPKCEELPDGNVVLSCRKKNGRYFNIFSYDDTKTAAGQWGKVVESDKCEGGIKVGNNATNGEIAVVRVRRTQDNARMYLALQSIPAGNDRSRVSIFYKELSDPMHYSTPEFFASHWRGSYLVTEKGSAYSTFSIQKDKRLAFFYEVDPVNHNYNLVYSPLSIEIITDGRYRAD